MPPTTPPAAGIIPSSGFERVREKCERGRCERDHVLLSVVEPGEDVARGICRPRDRDPTVTRGIAVAIGRPGGPGLTDPHVVPSFTAVERARYAANSSVAPRIPAGASTAPAIQARLAASVYTTAPPT